MPCYHPVKAFRTPDGVCFSELGRFDIVGSIELPCGQCIGCRMRRASDWELRVMHEASLHAESCFLTLTYAPGKLPPYGSLCHEDVQKFLRALRKKLRKPVRFYMCGEYGELHDRPHYHICLFGVDFADRVLCGRSSSGADLFESQLLTQLWHHGRATVQPLVRETASYCARYIMKKVLGDAAKAHYTRVDADGVMHEVKPEYAAMSLKPGIGAGWFEKYSRDVFPHDKVVSNGSERRVPRYYDKLARRSPIDTDSVEFNRLVKAKRFAKDQTEDRLAVREQVHLARVSTLKRDLT